MAKEFIYVPPFGSSEFQILEKAIRTDSGGKYIVHQGRKEYLVERKAGSPTKYEIAPK